MIYVSISGQNQYCVISNFCFFFTYNSSLPDEVLERLRHRDIHPNLQDLQILKEELCQKRVNISKHIKSEPWTMDELEKVLNSLQLKKCCDPHGYVNDLFKNASAGSD